MKGFESVLCICRRVQLPSTTKLRQANVFTGVCHSLHREGLADIQLGDPPQPADGTHPTGMHSCLINYKYTGSNEYGLKRVTDYNEQISLHQNHFQKYVEV